MLALPLETLVAHGHRALVHGGHRAFARDVLLPRAGDLGSIPGARVVKHNKVRTVVRLEGPEGGLYAKRFRVSRLVDRLVHLVKPSPARRERDALEALRRAGVACPEPVLLAEERRRGLLAGSVLVTREVAQADELTRTLDRLRAGGASESRRVLLEGVARVVREVLRAGVDHPDLHVGNLLVRGPLAAPELVVLDLHSARLRGGPLGASARRRRLGKLAHSLGLFDPDTAAWGAEELGWFATAWAALDPELGPAEPLRADLRARASAIERARLSSRDRRCLVDSTTFAVEGPPGRRVLRRRAEIEAELALALVDAPAEATVHAHPRGRSRIELVRLPAGRALGARRLDLRAGKADGDARVDAGDDDERPLAPRLEEAGPPDPMLVRKRYLFPTWRSRLAALFVEPLPLRCWRAARACEVRFVPAPRHLALVVEGWPLPRRATLLMERLACVSMIHVLLDAPTPLAPAARRRLATDAGRVLGRFHGAGLVHRDLAVQNLLVRPRGHPSSPSPPSPSPDGREGWDVWVIDLDEVSVAPLTREGKLRALTQLADLPATATRTDRLRFFRAYLASGGAEVLASELAELGARGLGRVVAERLRERAVAKARRLASRGMVRPAPTDLGALRG